MSSSIHYDPVGPWSYLTDRLAQQAFHLRHLLANNNNGEMQETQDILAELTLTLSQLLTPLSYTGTVRAARSMSFGFVKMQQLNAILSRRVETCRALVASLTRRPDQDEVRTLTIQAALLQTSLYQEAEASYIGGKMSATNKDVQLLFDTTRTALDMFRDESMAEGGKVVLQQAIIAASHARHSHFKLDRVRMSIIQAALIRASQADDDIEKARTEVETALRQIKHLCMRHSIELVLPPQLDDEDTEANGVDQLAEIIEQLKVSEVEEGVSHDMAKKIRHTLKHISKVRGDEELQDTIKDVRFAIKESESSVGVSELIDALEGIRLLTSEDQTFENHGRVQTE